MAETIADGGGDEHGQLAAIVTLGGEGNKRLIIQD